MGFAAEAKSALGSCRQLQLRQCASTAQDPVLAQAAQAEAQQEGLAEMQAGGTAMEGARQRLQLVQVHPAQMSSWAVMATAATPSRAWCIYAIYRGTPRGVYIADVYRQ